MPSAPSSPTGRATKKERRRARATKELDQSVPISAIKDPDQFQQRLLPGVSRTFALTIPELPAGLQRVVANHYLLCRIADTIEDDESLTPDQKDRFGHEFSELVHGRGSVQSLISDLEPRLSSSTPVAERELVAHTDRVLALTHSFSPVQQEALGRCVRIMSSGMRRYQHQASLSGLKDVDELEDYCYHVAGVVGEALTDLFCEHSSEIASRRDKLEPYAVSFGQGLQMTNILKDFWDDRQRGVCWFPRDVFSEKLGGFRDLTPTSDPEVFSRGLTKLIGIAHRHLRRAMKYTLSIPRSEPGIRKFCLWAIGMAVLTLRKVHAHPNFESGAQVKISRRAVKATVALSNLSVKRNSLLRLLFFTTSIGLPTERRGS